MFPNKYDVIVVGAGHAGSEAAAAAANLGAKTLLITMNLQNIARMSCNPAMGGIAKGQIIKKDSLLAFPEEFTELFTATLTDSTARDDDFLKFARSFIDLQKMAFSSYSDSTVYQFNQSINNCVECHRTRCPGPIPEIKKLLIN